MGNSIVKVQVLATLVLITHALAGAVEPSDSTQIDKARLKGILFSVLDTLRAEPDSSAFTNPMLQYPAHLRLPWQEELIEEGFGFPPASALYRGIDMATRDILKGRFAIKYTGEMIVLRGIDSTSWRTGPIYTHILKSRFGIILESVLNGPGQMWYRLFAKGYNQVAVPVLDRYFKCDVRATAWDSIESVIRQEGQQHRDEWISRP